MRLFNAAFFSRLAFFMGGMALLTACGSASAVPPPTATVPAGADPVSTAVATPPPTATAVAVAAPATATPQPTSTPAPTITPTPTTAPLTQADVPAPPYAESACSDKYPCNEDVAAWESRIQLPPGYTAAYFAYLADEQPTGLTFGPDGRLYVTVQSGTIYAVDENGTAEVYADGLISPTGLAFRPGTRELYVSSRVEEANVDGEAQVARIDPDGTVTQILGGLPCCYAFMHGPHDIVFTADGMGYVGVGARADHGEILGSDNEQDEIRPLEAGLVRFAPDGSTAEKVAFGLRNPYGLAQDSSGTLYATDNGPDYGPPDEMHRLVMGGHHGYPYYDCDDCFAAPADLELEPPTFQFPPHSSPTGMVAYTHTHFPGAYDHLFATLWSAFEGAQKVVRFGPGGEGAADFATGFAAPIDAAVDENGRLYVADWATGIVFQISYVGEGE